MDYVTELPLAELNPVLANWKEAAEGAILQVRLDGRIVVGIRTSYNYRNSKVEAFAIVGGERLGELVLRNPDGSSLPALDVTERVTLIARDPAPFDQPNVRPGMLLRHAEYPNAVFMWATATTPGTGPVSGAVCVSSDGANVTVGETLQSIERGKMSALAQSIGFVLRNDA